MCRLSPSPRPRPPPSASQVYSSKRRKAANSKDASEFPYATADDAAPLSASVRPTTSPSAGTTETKVNTFTEQPLVSQETYLASRELATKSEARLIRLMRIELGDLLTTGHVASCREVVGSISLLRFLRGANNHLVRAVELFRMHLDTRKELKWHEIRARVVSAPNFDPLYFTLDDMMFGALAKEHWKITLCAGYSAAGDPLAVVLVPVSDAWIDIVKMQANVDVSGASVLGEAFFSELFVRRQLQLDFLSRQQGKMVCLETVFDFAGGISNSYWKLFTRVGYRNFQLGVNRIVGCCPNIQGRVHIMRASWWMRWSCRNLWWIADALLRRKIVMYSGSGSDYAQLCSKVGMSGLVTIVEHISKLSAVGVTSSFALPQTMSMIPAGGVAGQSVPHLHTPLLLQMPVGGASRVAVAPETTKEVIPTQCVVQRGNVKLQPGVSHEVMVEVNQNLISATRWKFTVVPQPVTFSATFFRMNQNPDDPILESVDVVPEGRLATGEGLIEVEGNGCLLLRWTNEMPSMFNVWSSWSRTEDSVDYEVESVPRNMDSFAASAIGLLMLGAGDREN